MYTSAPYFQCAAHKSGDDNVLLELMLDVDYRHRVGLEQRRAFRENRAAVDRNRVALEVGGK